MSPSSAKRQAPIAKPAHADPARGGVALPAVTALHDAQQKRLQAVAEVAAAQLGLEVLAVHIAGASDHVQVLIDRKRGEGSVRLEDCVRVSRALNALLDEADGEQDYELEVSSPGMNRPLRHQDDFERFLGITAKVTVDAGQGPDITRETLIGVIEAVADGQVTLRTARSAKAKPGKAKPARHDAKKQSKAEVPQTQVVLLDRVVKACLNPSLQEWSELGRKLAAENAARGDLPSETDADAIDEEDETATS